MHDKREWTDEELEAMAQQERDAALDACIIAVLEKSPRVHIPEDFAARVAAKTPARRAVRLSGVSVTPRHYGWRVMTACLVLLMAGMVGISAAGWYRMPMVELVDWLLFAQFLGLLGWMGWRKLRTES